MKMGTLGPQFKGVPVFIEEDLHRIAGLTSVSKNIVGGSIQDRQ